MAHNAQAVFFKQVKKTFPEYFKWSVVLEVGSLDINGSVRPLFEDCIFLGVDVGHGPGVDMVCFGENLQFRDESFDTVVSSECFEHAEGWADIFANMKRMTKPNGLIVFTCAGKGRPEHGTSRSDVGSSPLTVGHGIEYYGNLMIEDFEKVPGLLDGLHYQSFYNPYAQDLYFVAKKIGTRINGNLEEESSLVEEVDWNGINAENF